MLDKVPTVLREPAEPGKPVVDPAVWTGAEIAKRADWLHVLTETELTALAEIAARVRREIGDDPNGILRTAAASFDLGAFAGAMDEVFHRIREGCGFQLIRGMPVRDWDRLDLAIAYWALGLRIGTPLSNNPDGDMIGSVIDLGKDYDNPNHRGYQTSAHMLFHTDQCDVVSLLCLETAKSGGRSKIVSAPAVHNEMVRRRPDLAAELAREMYWTRHGEVGSGETPWYKAAIFNFVDGYLTTAGGRKHIEKGHALPGNPPLSAAQKAAFALLGEINEELHLSMSFRVGDIQILNSHVTMHSRTAYEDRPGRPRHLWRLWLQNDDIRPRPPAFRHRTRGIRTEKTQLRIAL